MELILLERVEKLGQMGDVVRVKPGYARNFLLPKGKALRATEANKKLFENKKAQLEADNLARRTEAEAVAAKMDGLFVTVLRQAGEAGQLYGSVNSRDVAVATTGAGFTIARPQVELARPIKAVGLHEVLIKLHPEVGVGITVNVARSEEEAAIQKETGRAVIGADEEEEEQEAATESPQPESPESQAEPAAETAESAEPETAEAETPAPESEESTTEPAAEPEADEEDKA